LFRRGECFLYDCGIVAFTFGLFPPKDTLSKPVCGDGVDLDFPSLNKHMLKKDRFPREQQLRDAIKLSLETPGLVLQCSFDSMSNIWNNISPREGVPRDTVDSYAADTTHVKPFRVTLGSMAAEFCRSCSVLRHCVHHFLEEMLLFPTLLRNTATMQDFLPF
jgi:hypothetical protein